MPLNLLTALADASKLPLEKRIERVLALTALEVGASVAAIWRYNPLSGHCSCFARTGYYPKEVDPKVFVIQFAGSLIAEIVFQLNQLPQTHAVVDLSDSKILARHWAPDAISQLKVLQLIAIPFFNLALPTVELRTQPRGVVLYYFPANVTMDEGIARFLTSTFSDLYSTLYLKKKDEVTDKVVDVFVEQDPSQTPTTLLDTVCRTICVDTIGVQACSIYEWSAMHSGYRLSATTGIENFSSEQTIIDRRGDGLISAIASRARSVLIDNMLDREEVEKKLRTRIDPRILMKNVERTQDTYTGAMFVPVLNPIASKERFPTALIKFVNKKHWMTDLVDFFDIEDQLLGEEIARMMALYEEQARSLRQLEAFALQFGHEAQAPAVGIRGTADRILYRIDRGEQDDRLIASMAQDAFDFAEIMISFAESLNFGFGDRRISRQQRYQFRQTNLTKCIESARKVVMPICRAEGIHPENIRIFGTFPRIYVDNRAFMQVFYNLMTNAIKYRDKETPKDFSIQVSSKLVEHPEGLTDRSNMNLSRIWKRMVDGGYIRKGAYLVDFSDFGVGIEEDEIAKVFWEGFRSPLISAQEIRGSGIGLTIVRNILADFDSLIWVESRQSPTIFRVMIPDIVESSNYARKDRARSWRDG
jgi:signal transduction histidine kinase